MKGQHRIGPHRVATVAAATTEQRSDGSGRCCPSADPHSSAFLRVGRVFGPDQPVPSCPRSAWGCGCVACQRLGKDSVRRCRREPILSVVLRPVRDAHLPRRCVGPSAGTCRLSCERRTDDPLPQQSCGACRGRDEHPAGTAGLSLSVRCRRRWVGMRAGPECHEGRARRRRHRPQLRLSRPPDDRLLIGLTRWSRRGQFRE